MGDQEPQAVASGEGGDIIDAEMQSALADVYASNAQKSAQEVESERLERQRKLQ